MRASKPPEEPSERRRTHIPLLRFVPVKSLNTPVKVGLCIDFPMSDMQQAYRDALDLAFHEALDSQLIDRPIEPIADESEGLPRGEAFAVLESWKRLANMGCVVIVGPSVSDNAVAVRQHIESTGHIPTIGWCGTERFYGEWCFGIGNGSLSDEPYLIAEYLGSQGASTVAVVEELSIPGEEYSAHFRNAARREGLQIVHVETIGQTATDLDRTAARLQASQPDAVAYLGFGLPAMDLNDAFDRLGWNPFRVTTTAFINAYASPEWMWRYRGWVGVDQYDETNPVAQDFLDRFEARFSYRPDHCVATLAYDTGRLVALAISKASPLSPLGVKVGLEQIKALRAATGSPGTRLGFGPFVRRAWHGTGYLVMRQVDEDARRTILRARFH